MVKVKAFIQALSLFSSHPEKCKKYLEDKRLTQAEKTILRGYFLYRDSKFDEVVGMLAEISDITDTVVRSQWHLLMGLCYGNMNNFKLAFKDFELSLKYLPRNELKYFEFLVHLNLFTIHYNTHDTAGMKKQIKLLKGFKMVETKEVLRLHFCQFLYFSFVNKIPEAKEVLEELNGFKDKMSESDIVDHLLQECEFYIKLKDIKSAQSVLVEMKQNRKFAMSENYQYLKKMLDHYVDHKPLYFQDHEFEKQPVLLYHIKVIQQLEERKLSTALVWWSKLQELYPDSFHDDFKYTGPQNLFFLCFQLHQSAFHSDKVEFDESQGRSQAIIDFLERSNGPVSREVLFKILWNREATEKEDYVRLSRKMYRLKKQFNLKIEYRKGCYLLALAAKKKAS